MQATRGGARVIRVRLPRPRRDRGATGLEYGLMIAGGAIVALIGVTTLGDQTAQIFQCMSDQFRSQGKATCGESGGGGGNPTSPATTTQPGPTSDDPTSTSSATPTPTGSSSSSDSPSPSLTPSPTPTTTS